jgi:hypothetical protein
MTPQMLTYKKKFPTCMHMLSVDLTKGKGEHRNWFCPDCRTHWFKGKEYNPDQWDKWLEEED